MTLSTEHDARTFADVVEQRKELTAICTFSMFYAKQTQSNKISAWEQGKVAREKLESEILTFSATVTKVKSGLKPQVKVD